MSRRNPDVERLERENAMLRASLRRAHEQPGDIPFAGCGDSSCITTPGRGGQHTNGGCRCDERALRRAVQYWRRVADQRQALIQAHVDDRMREVGRNDGIELCAIEVENVVKLGKLAEHLRKLMGPSERTTLSNSEQRPTAPSRKD